MIAAKDVHALRAAVAPSLYPRIGSGWRRHLYGRGKLRSRRSHRSGTAHEPGGEAVPNDKPIAKRIGELLRRARQSKGVRGARTTVRHTTQANEGVRGMLQQPPVLVAFAVILCPPLPREPIESTPCLLLLADPLFFSLSLSHVRLARRRYSFTGTGDNKLWWAVFFSFFAVVLVVGYPRAEFTYRVVGYSDVDHIVLVVVGYAQLFVLGQLVC